MATVKKVKKAQDGAKKFAALAPPYNKVTFADKIAGAKKSAPKAQAGLSVPPSKRVGPIDPKGAWTKVQEKTIAGSKAAKVPLKKDKPLMKMGGKMSKKGAKMSKKK